MKLNFVENDLYDDDVDEETCPNCFKFGFNAATTMNSSSSGSNSGNNSGCNRNSGSGNIRNKPQKQQTLNANFKSHQQHQTTSNGLEFQQQQQQNFIRSKDLIGNSKEFRIENNKCNLRIIGNGNRIRISINTGNLQIIGNNTRLKIKKNNGNIKYTGNDGRICLGSESSQQLVDYIGCNGLLKVVNSTEFNKSPSATTTTTNDKVNNSNNNNQRINFPGNATNGTSLNSSTTFSVTPMPKVTSTLNSRVKSASCDSIDDTKNAKWQHFNDLLQQEGLQQFAKVSLPNLKDDINTNCTCDDFNYKNTNKKQFNDAINSTRSGNNNPNNNRSGNSNNNTNTTKDNRRSGKSGIQISNKTNIVNSFGGIVIKNSVNISIA